VARVLIEANRLSDTAALFKALGSARPKPAAQSTFH
jgi:hypothetical protein